MLAILFPITLRIAQLALPPGNCKCPSTRLEKARFTSAAGIVSCHPGNMDPPLASISCRPIELYCNRSGNKDEERAEGILVKNAAVSRTWKVSCLFSSIFGTKRLFASIDHSSVDMANTLIIQALIALVGFLVYHQVFRKPKRNLPPGPKGLPLIGNILDLPSKGTPDHVHWKSINDKYGPVASVTVLGQSMIFIADKEAAQEIMEKKSQTSSGRPVLQFANYCGFGEFISLHQLEKRFTSQRKVMHKAIGTKVLATKYADIQEREAGRLLLRTLKDPQKIVKHFET